MTRVFFPAATPSQGVVGHASWQGSALVERIAGRVMLLWGWRRMALAGFAGALAVLAQAPYDFFAICFVSFPVLVWLLDGAVERAPAPILRRFLAFFAVGWSFGMGYLIAGFWWIGNATLVEAESFLWALPFVFLGLPLILAPFFGLAAMIARLFWSDGLGRIAALAFGFGVSEWLRNWLPWSGFPWNPIGYAAMPTPLLMQAAHHIGTFGMNTVAVFVFAMPALLAGRRHVRAGAVLVLVLVALQIGIGFWRLNNPIEGKPLTVRIVQPSIDLAEKWEGAVRDRIFATTLNLSKAPHESGRPEPELVLWPETSIPFLLTERPDALQALAGIGSPLALVGAVRGEGSGDDTRYYNSLVAVDSSGAVADAVDKVHLVPFGEYMPMDWLFGWLGVEQIVSGPMNFMAGAAHHPFVLPGGLRAAPFICYEVIFPAEVETAVQDADLIVNVTNDAWFGDTAGPYQHFRNLQVRAAETGMPALRAANNGISGAVDAKGRIVDALAMNARARLDLTITVPPRETKPLLGPSATGLAIVAAMGLLALLFTAYRNPRTN